MLTDNRYTSKKREARINAHYGEGARTAARMVGRRGSAGGCDSYQAGNDERWQEFYAAALAMVQKRPLHEISLMRTVAEQTVEAAEFRQIAA